VRNDSKRRERRAPDRRIRSITEFFRKREDDEFDRAMERILPTIAPALRLCLAEYCRATGQGESAVIRMAVRQYIEDEEQLDELELTFRRIEQEFEDLSKAFGRFLQRCLASWASPKDRIN